MMKDPSFYIIGGDMRSVFLANSLAKAGFTVFEHGLSGSGELSEAVVFDPKLEKLSECSAAVLPLPAANEEGFVRFAFSEEKLSVSELTEKMPENSVLIGGMLPESVKTRAQEKGIKAEDYYEREEFSVRNAALTAEAAVSLAMEMLEESISETPVLVLGHGRIGRLLGAILKALDAKVTVAARRCSDLAWIRSEGSEPLEFSKLNGRLGEFRIIFNTVPAPVLLEEQLRFVQKDAIIIDLASLPGGTDFAAAKSFGIKAVNALGLPGKFAPKTAGEILKDTVLNIMREREANPDE